MEEKKQYKTYIESLKKQCLIGSVGSCVALISILLFIFIPFLTIKIEDVTIHKLSIFDASKQIYDLQLNDVGAGEQGIWFMGISSYAFIAVIYLVVTIIMMIVDVVKRIEKIYSIDNYAFKMYDEIKRRVDDKYKEREKVNAYKYFITSIVMEIIYIVCIILLSRFLEEGGILKEMVIEGIEIYDFMLVNGIEGTVAISIIFGIIALVLMFVSKKMLSNVKIQIMKEEYEG